jgi:hypothetical protein
MLAGQAPLASLIGVSLDLHVGEQANAGHEYGEGNDHPTEWGHGRLRYQGLVISILASVDFGKASMRKPLRRGAVKMPKRAIEGSNTSLVTWIARPVLRGAMIG